MTERLFVLASELRDDDRTVLEAIEKLGSLTAREAGRIVYQMQGRRPALGADRLVWMISAGRRALRRLERDGLVMRRRARWTRIAGQIADRLAQQSLLADGAAA